MCWQMVTDMSTTALPGTMWDRFKVQKELLDQQGLRELQVLQEQPGQLAQLGQLDPRVLQDHKAILVLQALQAQLDLRVQPDLLDHREIPVQQVLPVLQEQPDHKAFKAIQEQPAHKAFKVM